MRILEVPSLVLRVSFRNLWLYRLKTIIIATLLGMGTFIAIVGLTLLKDVETSMRASIIGSVAGHLQLYSKQAKDDLAIFGSSFMGRQDIGFIQDLAVYRDAVMSNPEVQDFIPMGSDMGMLGRGNEMDDSLDALRAALKGGDPTIITDRVDQLRFQLETLVKEIKERRKLLSDMTQLDKQELDLKQAMDPTFLEGVKRGEEDRLQFLETRIAPLSGEKQPIYLMYLGTDIGLFEKNFSKFYVKEGQALPPGQRGILLSNKVREDQLKNIVARLFDRLKKRVVRSGVEIAGDPENQRLAQDLTRQYGQVTAYLDRDEALSLRTKLEAYGIKPGTEDLILGLTEQLKSFLTVNDTNFVERYDWFYQNIAPMIRLYEISPGETIMLRSYTRSGYLKSLPLKIYGVYSFQGLEDSDLAGVMNIVDLVSFRELYGQMTDASLKELQEMRAQVGIKDVSAENAEDALFGEGASGHIEAERVAPPVVPAEATIQVKPMIPELFDPIEIQSGLALNAAIRLKDESQIDKVRQKLEEQLRARGLEAKVVDWQKASGFVGQFVNIVRGVLIFALVVIFIVALVIINNSIIVGTLNRMREIGTMRAIGAQKSFVVGMFLAETAITGMIGALLGTLLALSVLIFLGWKGIPATTDVVTFLFSGPRLHPKLHPWILTLSPIVIVIVATLASIYAARHAAHIQPAEAMQEKE